MPSTSRPPLTAWSVAAILATTDGWRFITLSTKGPSVARVVMAAAALRIVHASTTGTVGSPFPMK